MNLIKSIFCGFIFVSIAACTDSTYTVQNDGPEAFSNISESVMSDIGGIATSTEALQTPAVFSFNPEAQVSAQSTNASANFTINPGPACTFVNARNGGCSNVNSSAVMTTNWNNCAVYNTSGIFLDEISGGWIETYTPAAACTTVWNNNSPVALPASSVVARTTTSFIIVSLAGASIVEDTNVGSTYDQTTTNGNGVTVTTDGSGNRTVTFDSLHKIMRGPHGTLWFDHIITANSTSGASNSAQSITITGSKAAGNRTASGTLTVYHNASMFTAVQTFNSVRWGNPNCCYPTSGTITGVLTGAITGNVTLDFSPGAGTCGAANFTDQNSQTSTITLSQCQ